MYINTQVHWRKKEWSRNLDANHVIDRAAKLANAKNLRPGLWNILHLKMINGTPWLISLHMITVCKFKVSALTLKALQQRHKLLLLSRWRLQPRLSRLCRQQIWLDKFRLTHPNLIQSQALVLTAHHGVVNNLGRLCLHGAIGANILFRHFGQQQGHAGGASVDFQDHSRILHQHYSILGRYIHGPSLGRCQIQARPDARTCQNALAVVPRQVRQVRRLEASGFAILASTDCLSFDLTTNCSGKTGCQGENRSLSAFPFFDPFLFSGHWVIFLINIQPWSLGWERRASRTAFLHPSHHS